MLKLFCGAMMLTIMTLISACKPASPPRDNDIHIANDSSASQITAVYGSTQYTLNKNASVVAHFNGTTDPVIFKVDGEEVGRISITKEAKDDYYYLNAHDRSYKTDQYSIGIGIHAHKGDGHVYVSLIDK